MLSSFFRTTIVVVAIVFLAFVYYQFCGYTCHKCFKEGWGIRYEGPNAILCSECYEKVFNGEYGISDPHHLYRERIF